MEAEVAGLESAARDRYGSTCRLLPLIDGAVTRRGYFITEYRRTVHDQQLVIYRYKGCGHVITMFHDANLSIFPVYHRGQH